MISLATLLCNLFCKLRAPLWAYTLCFWLISVPKVQQTLLWISSFCYKLTNPVRIHILRSTTIYYLSLHTRKHATFPKNFLYSVDNKWEEHLIINPNDVLGSSTKQHVLTFIVETWNLGRIFLIKNLLDYKNKQWTLCNKRHPHWDYLFMESWTPVDINLCYISIVLRKKPT